MMPFSTAKIALTIPAIPLVPSKCPTFVFAAPLDALLAKMTWLKDYLI